MTTNRSDSFGDLLRRYRQEIGLTQEELAERANVSTRAISERWRLACEIGDRAALMRGALALLGLQGVPP